MEYRFLGASGLQVPVLTFGTGTFGGNTPSFRSWGNTQAEEASRMIGLCLDAGVNAFDTADIYSDGESEEVLGKALEGIGRDRVIISTKSTFPFNRADRSSANYQGSSRLHVVRSCEASLRRLGTDYIDIYHMHGFDGNTPVEETLRALDDLVSNGKVRYIACSNFSGWHLMKSLAVSDRYGWSRYVAHQVYYTLAGREYEWELMPLGIDQGVGALVWSPLAAGRLSGRYRREQPMPPGRVAQGGSPVPQSAVDNDQLYAIVDVLDEIAAETGRTVPQIALNWLLWKPTVSSIIIGARDEAQLRDNLDATGWQLSREQVARLDAVSERPTIYPYWHQRQNLKLNPVPPSYDGH